MAIAVLQVGPNRQRSWRIWTRAVCQNCATQSDPALEALLLQSINLNPWTWPDDELADEPALLPATENNPKSDQAVDQGETDEP
jgi:hypothetical protein